MKLLAIAISLLATTLMYSPYESGRFVRHYYPDGVLKAEGWIRSEKKSGYWRQYHPNGILASKGHYDDDIREDYWYFYQPDGLLKREGHYKDGYMAGWWLYYDQQGQIDYKCQLIDGEKHGYCLKYQGDQLVSAVKYENGRRIKEWFSLQSFKRENNVYDLK